MGQSKKKFICQWSLEIIFGKKREALDILKKWGEEKFRSSNFKVSQSRMISGYIGASPSIIIDEYIFDSIADFEKALADMSQPQFKQYSEAIAPLIVPGSQKWTVFESIEY